MLVDPPPPGGLPGNRPLLDTANSSPRRARPSRDRHPCGASGTEARRFWPAFWALGTDIDQEGWPECGEFDIMENPGQEPGTASGTIHGPRDGAGTQAEDEPGHSVQHTAPLPQQFHTYGVQWLPGSIQFTIDGRPYGSITATDLPAGSRWVFDHPFFPKALRVDYVRVYR